MTTSAQHPQSAYDKARLEGRRVFYEAATETIRQAPENYLLAQRNAATGRWYPSPDHASPINAHSLGIVLRQYQEEAEGDELARAIERAFWGW